LRLAGRFAAVCASGEALHGEYVLSKVVRTYQIMDNVVSAIKGKAKDKGKGLLCRRLD
jgi:hypothetical protein